MFLVKQILKAILLPPGIWLLALAVVWVFWKRRWARPLLAVTIVAVALLHLEFVADAGGYLLESRYPLLRDVQAAGDYDAIVVLGGGVIRPVGLIPFPSLYKPMFRRLEEAHRLYRQRPKPIVVSGGSTDPFLDAIPESRIASEYLLRWGVPQEHVLAETSARDTFENAREVARILAARGWRRYLLVTSAVHMPRSMMVFRKLAPEPIAAPADFTVGGVEPSPFELLPDEGPALASSAVLNEYLGLLNYVWRLRFGGP